MHQLSIFIILGMSILRQQKIKMKRMSAFYMTKRKKAKDIVKQLQTIELQNQRSKLKKLLSQRKSKWKQTMANQQIRHPNFNYLKKDYSQFSVIDSNASKQIFLTQKQKRKLQTSDRAYSSSPNMKVGNSNNLFKRKSQIEDEIVLNRKFMEYDYTIDSNSPHRRIKALQKLNINLYDPNRKKSSMMKKTYFQKFIPDKYNFYSVNQFNTIKSSALSRNQTDREMKSRLQISKLKHIHSSTLDTQKSQQVSILNRLNRSRLKSQRSEQLQASKSINKAKSRIKSNISDKLMPISLQKNINSLQY